MVSSVEEETLNPKKKLCASKVLLDVCLQKGTAKMKCFSPQKQSSSAMLDDIKRKKKKKKNGWRKLESYLEENSCQEDSSLVIHIFEETK